MIKCLKNIHKIQGIFNVQNIFYSPTFTFYVVIHVLYILRRERPNKLLKKVSNIYVKILINAYSSFIVVFYDVNDLRFLFNRARVRILKLHRMDNFFYQQLFISLLYSFQTNRIFKFLRMSYFPSFASICFNVIGKTIKQIF